MSQINSAASIISGNLSLLSGDSASVSERRLVQLQDLAKQLLRDPSQLFGETRVIDFEKLFTEEKIAYGAPGNFKGLLAYENKTRVFYDRVALCSFLRDEMERMSMSPIEKLIDNKPYGDSCKIAYFRNAYADAAFRIFSDVIDNPSAVYASDFSAVCEEVYYGRCDMCMLPLDSSKDAKLVSFYRLIDKYELNIVYSCDVTTPDGSVTTRYALLKRGMAVPESSKLDNENSCFFELGVTLDGNDVFEAVLSAANIFGLTLYRADSIPITYGEGKFACDLIFKIGNARGLNAFVLYLGLVIPQYEPIGIYPHIRSEEK